jgi:hypothetical protein
MNRTRILPLLCLLACGHGNRPPPQDHIALPSGALLKPFDPAKPGEARPLYTAQLGGRVYATLSNARAEGSFPVTAGPGFLASIDPFAGSVDLIDLGGSDGHQCTNPGVVRADAGKLYVACSGDFSGVTPGRGVFEVDPISKTVSRGLVTANGFVPSGVAVTASRIWLGDSSNPQPTTCSGKHCLISVDRATFAGVDGSDAAHPPIPVPCPDNGQFPFIPYVGIVSGDLYALCAAGLEAGVLTRFDAQTGAAKGSVKVVGGAQPTEFAATGDGRIAVVNSIGNTLTLVTPGATLTAQVALTFKSPTDTLQDVKTRGQLVFTVASGSNTVQKIDLAAAGGPKVVAEANTGLGSNPFNLEALDDDTVVVVNYATSDVVSRTLTTAQ